MKYLIFHFFLKIYRLLICIFLKCAPLIERNRYKDFHVDKMFAGATWHRQFCLVLLIARVPLLYQRIDNNSNERPGDAQAFSVSSFCFYE